MSGNQQSDIDYRIKSDPIKIKEACNLPDAIEKGPSMTFLRSIYFCAFRAGS